MLLYCVKSMFKDTVFKDAISKELYTSVIMNKCFNKTAQS